LWEIERIGERRPCQVDLCNASTSHNDASLGDHNEIFLETFDVILALLISRLQDAFQIQQQLPSSQAQKPTVAFGNLT
jgi:hypothetical protein